MFRLFGIDVRVRRPPPLGHQVVLGSVDGDPVQPGIKGALAAKLPQSAISLDERLLCHVQHFTLIAHIAGNQFDDLVLILAHQHVESLFVPLLYTFDELLIDALAAHEGNPFCVQS